MQDIKVEAEEIFKRLNSTDFDEEFKTGCDGAYYNDAKELKLFRDSPAIWATEPPVENSTEPTDSRPNTTDFLPLYEEWRKYYQYPVSVNASAVHVPINVYNCSK